MKLKLDKLILHLLFITLSILVIYPLYFALISALKDTQSYTMSVLAFPGHIIFDNFKNVLLNMNMLRYLFNSIFVVSVTMALYIIICSAAGFAFGKLNFQGRMFIFTMVLFLQIFPQMVLASELYYLLSKMGLVNNFAGIIVAWLAYFTPFGTYIMTTFYASVPRAIVESARIDGANIFQQLFYIMIPIGKPMLGTIGIVGFLAMWNELPFSMLILQQPELRTVTLGIALLQGEFGLPVPTLSAAVIISAIVPLILYLIFQNFITMGATAGSTKG